jgi:hypothetical protein
VVQPERKITPLINRNRRLPRTSRNQTATTAAWIMIADVKLIDESVRQNMPLRFWL